MITNYDYQMNLDLSQPKKNQTLTVKQISQSCWFFKFLILLLILIPLLALTSISVELQEQHLFKALGIKQKQQILTVQKALEKLHKEIDKNKMILTIFNQQLNETQNSNQKNNSKNKQQSFLKQLQKIKQSQTKYFKFNESIWFKKNDKYDQLYQRNQAEAGFIEIKNRKQIEMIKQIENWNKKEEKHIFEIADKIIFSVTLMGINASQQLSKRSLEIVQRKILQEIQINNAIGMLLKVRSNQKTQKINQPWIQIRVKMGHMSQIDQNYHKKLRQIFSVAEKQFNDAIQPSDQIEPLYVQQVIEELQKTHKGNECSYFRNFIQCKQFQVFVLIDSFSRVNQLTQPGLNISNSKLNLGATHIAQKLNQISYWSMHKNKITLMAIPFQQLQNQIDHQQIQTHGIMLNSNQLNFQIFSSLLTQIIMENLNLSALLLLTQNSQQRIHQFIRLSMMYKAQSALQHILYILNTQEITYQNPSKQSIVLLKNFIQTAQQSFQQNVTTNLFSVIPKVSPLINGFNQMDPFPFDYKIGAILPIAIILVYPLIGFFKFSFIS